MGSDVFACGPAHGHATELLAALQAWRENLTWQSTCPPNPRSRRILFLPPGGTPRWMPSTTFPADWRTWSIWRTSVEAVSDLFYKSSINRYFREPGLGGWPLDLLAPTLEDIPRFCSFVCAQLTRASAIMWSKLLTSACLEGVRVVTKVGLAAILAAALCARYR